MVHQPSCQDKMLAVRFSANNRCVHISTSTQLRVIATFLQNLSFCVHMTHLRPDFNVGRWRGRWWSYRWEGCLSFFKCETTRDCDVPTSVGATQLDIYRPRRNLQPMFVATKLVFKLKTWSFTWSINKEKCCHTIKYKIDWLIVSFPWLELNLVQQHVCSQGR